MLHLFTYHIMEREESTKTCVRISLYLHPAHSPITPSIYVDAYIRSYICICIYTCIHTCIHTYIHTCFTYVLAHLKQKFKNAQSIANWSYSTQVNMIFPTLNMIIRLTCIHQILRCTALFNMFLFLYLFIFFFLLLALFPLSLVFFSPSIYFSFLFFIFIFHRKKMRALWRGSIR